MTKYIDPWTLQRAFSRNLRKRCITKVHSGLSAPSNPRRRCDYTTDSPKGQHVSNALRMPA